MRVIERKWVSLTDAPRRPEHGETLRRLSEDVCLCELYTGQGPGDTGPCLACLARNILTPIQHETPERK